ncbi:GTPase [Vreelandella aquamarina]
MKMNAIAKIDKNLEELFELSERYLGAEKVAILKEEYYAKKSESLLQVMLFGSYNAGKSSLINALLMQEVAAVGDVPKTSVAAVYSWNSCYLLDTPGVNAPIEHEEITESEIDRSELILFVVRQGDQDVKDVYERMFKMLLRNKDIFIVFNHELSPEQLPEALERLTDIMAKYASDYRIELQRVSEIPVIPVNVKTAMKARLKGSEPLAEHSGIAYFERVFMSWLRNFDNEVNYLDRLRKYIHQCLVSPLLNAISSENDTDKSTELKNLQYQRDDIIRQYDLLDSQVANHVRAEMVHLKPEIASVINKSSSKLEIESEIMQLSDGVVKSTADFLQQRCDEVIDDLNASLDIGVESDNKRGRSHVSDTIEKAVMEGARAIDAETIKNGLLMLRNLKFPGIKGRWEKTLGGWANKASWFVTAVVSAYEIYSASAEQDAQNAEQRRQVLGIHQAIEGIAGEISSAILDEARKIISGAKKKSVTQIDSKIQDITNNCEQKIKDDERVNSIAAAIDSLTI